MFRIKVMPEAGEPYEVVATTRDIAQWEKRNKGASLAKLQSDLHVVDLYKLAHLAVVRKGLFVGNLDDFESVTDLDVLDDEDPDPTNPAAS